MAAGGTRPGTVTVLNAVPDALLTLWLKLLADGVGENSSRLVLVAVLGIAASVAVTWVLNVSSTRITRRSRDRVTIALETHVARLQATIGTIAHQERPDYLDRLSVLGQQVFVLDHMYLSVLNTLAWLRGTHGSQRLGPADRRAGRGGEGSRALAPSPTTCSPLRPPPSGR